MDLVPAVVVTVDTENSDSLHSQHTSSSREAEAAHTPSIQSQLRLERARLSLTYQLQAYDGNCAWA